MKREFELRAHSLPFYSGEAAAFPIVFLLGFFGAIGLFMLTSLRGPILILPGAICGLVLAYVLWSVDHAPHPQGTLTIENGEIRCDAVGRPLRAFFRGPAPIVRIPLTDVRSMLVLQHADARGATLAVMHARGRLFVRAARLTDATLDDVATAIRDALPQAAVSNVDAASNKAVDFQRKVARVAAVVGIAGAVVTLLRVVLESLAH